MLIRVVINGFGRIGWLARTDFHAADDATNPDTLADLLAHDSAQEAEEVKVKCWS